MDRLLEAPSPDKYRRNRIWMDLLDYSIRLFGRLACNGTLYQGALFKNTAMTMVQEQMQANATMQIPIIAAIQTRSFLCVESDNGGVDACDGGGGSGWSSTVTVTAVAAAGIAAGRSAVLRVRDFFSASGAAPSLLLSGCSRSIRRVA
jgi:hypothetical protein